jgi:hypothetical protein
MQENLLPFKSTKSQEEYSPGAELLNGLEKEIKFNTLYALEDTEYKLALEKYINFLEEHYRKQL